MRRRRILAGFGIAAVGVAGTTIYRRGFRYPPGILEPALADRRLVTEGVEIIGEREVFISQRDDDIPTLRAFGPSPRVSVKALQSRETSFILSNVHPAAELKVEGGIGRINEDRDGLNRSVTITLADKAEAALEWQFPKQESYRFAALGDTGGNAELGWALQRAHDLGADFFLHLGDLNYWEGDFQRSIEYFGNAKLPSYVTIGNHDFHKEGPVYQPFIAGIGPRNTMFDLGGIRFLNIDTASDLYPPWRGERGRLVESLAGGRDIRDFVVFTHRPFVDPRPDYDHTINGIGETEWLHSRFLEAGATTMLAGHVHVKAELEFEGIHTYIAGQGLGNDDVISNRPVSEILIGDVNPGEPVSYHWEMLELPESRLCHPRNLVIMRAQGGKEDLIRRLEDSCIFTE
jgi:hypothetical protein